MEESNRDILEKAREKIKVLKEKVMKLELKQNKNIKN
jgi:BMFP domain-containing protein YqiC